MRFLLLLVLLLSFSHSNAQHQDKLDFINAKVSLIPNPEQKEIQGHVTYYFDVLADIDSIFLDAKNIDFSSVLIDYKAVRFTNNEERIILYENFKQGEERSITFEYTAKPKQTVYFFGWDDEIENNEQIWTQGQGKYTSHWLPSFDDMEEKIEFDLNITINEKYAVLANGKLLAKSNEEPDALMWSFDMQKPMSSYLLAFAIGNYDKQELQSKSGILIENYYYGQDSLKVEPTYRYTKEIFDFLEEEIGFPYPWQNYKQIPVHDFLYAGMENTTVTVFSDGYVIDSTAFVDKNYVNVNAHELAHQWFGNLVTEKDGNHHWLHEGFATYYAQLAEKKIFGDDHYYWKLFRTLQQLKNVVESGEGQALTDPKASSLIFYEKGAWALFMLRNQIGDTTFKKGIQNYLQKHQFKNVTISDFIKEMELVSETNLDDFRDEWLENTGFPLEKAKTSLAEKSKAIQHAFELESDLVTFQPKVINYKKYWNGTNSVHLKKQILEWAHASLPQEILEDALQADTIAIRQQLISVINDIKKLPYQNVVTLLQDESYVTIENSLFRLWEAYPEKRRTFLKRTKNVTGLPNKNVRLLWLTLAIVTNDYETRNTPVYFKELSNYTSKQYSWEVRMGAFQYLNQALGFDDAALKNLANACVHHSWQFKKYARNLLQDLLKDQAYKTRLVALTKELKGEEERYMNTKLKQ